MTYQEKLAWIKAQQDGQTATAICPICAHRCEWTHEQGLGWVAVDVCDHATLEFDYDPDLEFCFEG